MLHILFTAAGLLLTGSASGNFSKKDLQSDKSKASYAIGIRTTQNLLRQKVDLDKRAFIAGAEHALAGSGSLLMTDKEIVAVLENFRQARQKEVEKLGDKNKKDGEAFLAANAKKEGIVTLKSGLQYKVVTKGTGEMPKKGDTVVTHYVGTLLDGTEFDSSRRRGTPATFPVTGVIAGWVEALQLMPVGSKWMLYIPSQLAYGERGAGGKIGPNATLIFEIELLEIKKSK